MSEKKKKASRTRNFATVVYPESAKENWVLTLEELVVPCLISPLHDSDINPNGEAKKPHYHVLFTFEGVKSTEQVREIVEKIGGVGVETVNSIRGYARYLCHLDNAEKHRYSEADVIQMGGADYQSLIGLASDKYKAIKEILEYCNEEHVYSYADLLTYCSIHREDWFRVLCDSGTMVVSTFLKSKQWQLDRFGK